MFSQTLDTRIVNGQLQLGDLLRPYEGQTVRVTLTVPPPVPQKPQPTADEEDSSPPEGLDVEKEVVVRLPFPSEVVKDAIVVEGKPLRPCLIVPEDGFDDD